MLAVQQGKALAGQVKALDRMAQTGQYCGQVELCLVEAAAWGMGAAGALMDMIKCDIVEQDSQGQCPESDSNPRVCVYARSVLGMEKCCWSVGDQITGEQHFGKKHME